MAKAGPKDILIPGILEEETPQPAILTGGLGDLLKGRSPEAAADIRELARQEIERRKKDNPLKYFTPNLWQEDFINRIGSHYSSEKWIFCAPAANSLGKSAAVIAVLGNIIWGSQSPWFSKELFTRRWTYPKKIWYVSTQTALKTHIVGMDERTETEIKKFFPAGKYEQTKGGLDYYSQLFTDNGWQITFLTYDQDASQFESTKIGVAVFDEPPPQHIYNAVIARMTMGGIILMPMTPLSNSAWAIDRLVNGNNTGIDVFFGDIELNCKDHNERGFLSHRRITEILDQYDPDEIEARAHGRPTHLLGLIYHGLHSDLHNRDERDPGEFTQDKYRIFCIWDPHPAKPPALAWGAVDEFGKAFIIDEFPNQVDQNLDGSLYPPWHEIKRWKLSTQQICREIAKIEKRNGWNGKKIIRVMDPRFGRKPLETVGMTFQQFVAKTGREIGYPLSFSCSTFDEIDTGHQIVQGYLDADPDGNVMLEVTKRCKNVWQAFTHYKRIQRTGKRLEQDGPGEDVEEKFKDFMDVVRYFITRLRKAQVEHEVEDKRTEEEKYDDYVTNVVVEKIRQKSIRKFRNQTLSQIAGVKQ